MEHIQKEKKGLVIMRVQYKDKKRLLQAALGTIPADLAIVNAKVVNVFTGEILPATVNIFEGFISHIDYTGKEEVNANEIYDAKGQYLVPGFIDSHIHIESTMQTPRNFAKSVIPWGTTTVITDPHEIANVWGIEGVRYMHDCSDDVPMRQLIDIPSCVPAVPGIESCGADFTAKEIGDLLDLERVVGLAEVMDFLAVIQGDDRMMDILEQASSKGLYLQGHAPRLPERWLSAYLCGGPNTCHESITGEEALAKLRNGMVVDARESSISKNVEAIWGGVGHCKFFDTLTLCTDDRDPDDILRSGHINDVVNKAISCGMDPVTAIKSVTINSAREAKLENIGAVAPGYVADCLLVDELEHIVPSAVFYGGQLVAKDGQLLVTIPEKSYPIETTNSMNLPELTVEDFMIKAPISEGMISANVMAYPTKNDVYTFISKEELPVKDGYVGLGQDKNLKYVAVINRYGKKRMAVHVLRNFGSDSGAVASTVAHDCHNLTIVYEKPEDALVAARKLQECGGGMCAVKDGEILHTLVLQVGGLMSTKEAAELAEDARLMKEADRELGLVDQSNPLLRIATLALPVIPDVKMSDAGLVDVNTKEIISLIE